MATQRFFGRGGLARFLKISETRLGQINPQPDALVDGRPVWFPETAKRLKAEREARRGGKRSEVTSAPQPGEAAV